MIFGFCTSKKFDAKIILLISGVLSYLSLSILRLFITCDDVLKVSGISSVLLIVIAIIASKIFVSRRFSKALTTLFFKTPNQSIWKDVIDFKNGSNFKVYLKDKDYYVVGHLENFEETENPWFSLSGFVKLDLQTNGIIVSYEENQGVKIVFRLSDVEHIEVF